MNIKNIYNEMIGKYILTAKEQEIYKNIILPCFLSNQDKFLFYDNNQVLLLDEHEMQLQYKNGNYRNYGDLVETFDDFCVSCCVEVLKNFSDYSLEKICEEFKKHDMLNLHV